MDAGNSSSAPRTADALDLHGAIGHPARSLRCERWPKRLRLISSAGHFVAGRCRATNKCDYCARLEAVQVSEMLGLDAMKGDAPRVWCVLTTREPVVLLRQSPERHAEQTARFKDARRLVVRALRRRWPNLEYVCVVEFTTGYGARAGGERRPHWNLLLKGVDASETGEVERIVRAVWCERVDAEPAAQFVGEVAEVGGLMRYLALHFLKESQRPPEGWRGQRVTASRGYFGPRSARGSLTARARARAAAQASLRLKRAIYRAELAGHEGGEAVVVGELTALRNEGIRWECVVFGVDEATGVVLTARTLDGREPTVMRVDRTAERRKRLDWKLSESLWRAESASTTALWVAPAVDRQLPLLTIRRD